MRKVYLRGLRAKNPPSYSVSSGEWRFTEPDQTSPPVLLGDLLAQRHGTSFTVAEKSLIREDLGGKIPSEELWLVMRKMTQGLKWGVNALEGDYEYGLALMISELLGPVDEERIRAAEHSSLYGLARTALRSMRSVLGSSRVEDISTFS